MLFEKSRLKMAETVKTSGWDGRWFRRAYDNFGEPVGSSVNREGQVFIEPQGMCIMAGIGVENEMAKQALDTVEERLSTEHGVVLLHPAFKQYYLHLGEISSYPPGYKENGSVFCHTNPWVMIAETLIGRGDKAFDYYLRINPSKREEISEIHKCEPYVYAQMIAGKEAIKPGEAKNSWLTGTAAWNYVAITQWILGIRPEFDGLIIDPVIPSDWDGFSVRRFFRGKWIDINIHNNSLPGNNVRRMTLNGKELTENLIPFNNLGNSNSVEVWLGI